MTDQHDHDHEHDHDDEHEHHHHDGPHDYVGAIQGYRRREGRVLQGLRQQPGPAGGTRRVRRACRTTRSTSTSCSRAWRSSRTRATSRPTSRSRPRTASSGRRHRAGTFTFEIDGAAAAADRLRDRRRPRSDSSVFVPFLDATSGRETYGAGRYLDLEPDEDGTYAIDFNLAYHPSCVYSPRFSCPLTPAENRLSVRIEAGERLAEGAAH